MNCRSGNNCPLANPIPVKWCLYPPFRTSFINTSFHALQYSWWNHLIPSIHFVFKHTTPLRLAFLIGNRCSWFDVIFFEFCILIIKRANLSFGSCLFYHFFNFFEFQMFDCELITTLHDKYKSIGIYFCYTYNYCGW